MTSFSQDELNAYQDAMDTFRKGGVTVTDLAADIGVSRDALRYRWRLLGFDCVAWTAAQKEERDAQIVSLFRNGMGIAHIARQTGISETGVRGVLVQRGLVASPRPRPDKDAEEEARRHSVQLHRDDRWRTDKIAKHLGVSINTLYRWWKSAGYDPKGNTAEERAERDAEIVALFGEDKDAKEISEALDIPRTTVYAVLKDRGLIISARAYNMGYPSIDDVREGLVPGRKVCPICDNIIIEADEPCCEFCRADGDERKLLGALDDWYASSDGWWQRNTRKVKTQ